MAVVYPEQRMMHCIQASGYQIELPSQCYGRTRMLD
jgi:hypothetical protein